MSSQKSSPVGLLPHLQKILTDPQALAPPAGTAFSGTEIVLCGRDLIEIEGCRGLITYTEEEIGMLIKEGTLCINGQHLSLKIYRGAHIAICGNIQSVLFDAPSSKKEDKT